MQYYQNCIKIIIQMKYQNYVKCQKLNPNICDGGISSVYTHNRKEIQHLYMRCALRG
jgi:hypothetical protein